MNVFSISDIEEYVFHNEIIMVESENIPAQEISALQDLYVSTNGNEWNWRNTSYGIPWNFVENCNPCTEHWQGVTCRLYPNNSTLHVIEIALSDYNLNGTLPSTLKNFIKLERLIISINHLYGKLHNLSCTLFDIE